MNPKTLLPEGKNWLISLVVLVAAFLALRFLFPEETGELLEPTASLSLTVISLIVAFALKVNYTSKLFLADLIIGIFLASLFTFTQGLLTIILLLTVQKLLKLL